MGKQSGWWSVALLFAAAATSLGCSLTDLDALVGEGGGGALEGGGSGDGGGSEGGSSAGGEGGAGDGVCLAPLASCDEALDCATDLSTSVEHCGACGFACPGPNAACEQGSCVLTSQAEYTYRLRVDHTHIYLGALGLGRIEKLDGSYEHFPSTTGLPLFDLNLDETKAYAAVPSTCIERNGYQLVASGGVGRIDKPAPAMLDVVAAGDVTALAGNDSTLYLGFRRTACPPPSMGVIPAPTTPGAIRGASKTTVGAWELWDVATDDVGLPAAMTMDDDYVYWADAAYGTVRRGPLVGSGSETLAAGEGQLLQLIVTPEDPSSERATPRALWWSTGDGRIRRKYDGAAAETLIQEPAPLASFGLAYYGAYLYYTVTTNALASPTNEGKVKRIPRDCQSDCAALAETLFQVDDVRLAALAVDESGVYFADYESGGVYWRSRDAYVDEPSLP